MHESCRINYDLFNIQRTGSNDMNIQIQAEKKHLHALEELMSIDIQAARLVVALTRLLGSENSGVLVISRTGCAELIGVSIPTITRAMKTLVAGNWVQRMKIGTAYAIAVNTSVAWAARGDVVCKATVVVTRSEQSEAEMSSQALRRVDLACLE